MTLPLDSISCRFGLIAQGLCGLGAYRRHLLSLPTNARLALRGGCGAGMVPVRSVPGTWWLPVRAAPVISLCRMCHGAARSTSGCMCEIRPQASSVRNCI